MGCFKRIAGAALVAVGLAGAVSVSNPIIWSDSPDPSIVRVGENYYMVTTTMHYAPGVPIFKSTDLAQWRTIGYVYETLANNDNINLNGGKDAYGKGSWASSIRYREKDGYYYVLTPSYTTNKTHLYKTKDIENGGWSEIQLPFYHDPSLFFDDDGTAWIFYGSGDQISYVQLNDDASGVKAGGKSGKLGGVSVNQVTGTSNYYVQQEGSHMEKVNGEYYLFTISWPAGSCRSEIVYRSKSLLSGFSGRIFLQANGVAQGGIFDTPDGNWYALLFRDSGPVGRISHLVPTVWKDGWPEPAGGSKSAPATLDLPNEPEPGYGLVTSDDFDGEELRLEWQWNHNPDNSKWALTDGKLRITTGRTDSRIVNAKNTLTQRTFGPKCVGRTLVDGAGMKEGDLAGIAALQDDKGFVALTKSGNGYKVVMYQGTQDGETMKESVDIDGSQVYLRTDFDIPIDKGTASFYYSTDGSSWKKIGTNVNLSFNLHFFTGYRFALFNFATKTAGGYAEFDWFKVGETANDEIKLDDNSAEPVPQSPYCESGENCVAAAVPGRIEAENFDIPGVGSKNKSYKDNDGENQGDADFRADMGVDVVLGGSGKAIGYTNEGEWLEYTINVKTAGTYDLYANVASGSETSGFQFSVDGENVTDAFTAPKTGEDWSVYDTVKVGSVKLDAGDHEVRLTITGSFVNIDWFQFIEEGNVIEEPEMAISNKFVGDVSFEMMKNARNVQYFDLQGHRLKESATLNAGVYLVKVPGVGSRLIRVEKNH
ncbi:MAG: family 43 glycosylhydrolase [Fibrobacter sp.]|nr:family 43 glycosylhydrolase [Fibrobacter sp.]